MQSYPRKINLSVWALSLSLAATKEIDVSFSSSGYLDVSVPRVPSGKLCIGLSVLKVYLSGFPHSDIHGSKDICSSPWLFAAYHVLHRLSVPRHPPCALYSLTNSFESGSDWLAKLRWMFTFISCFVNLYEIICEAKDMSKSKAFTNNRLQNLPSFITLSPVYSVILMGFLNDFHHSVCFLVWYVTYQYISHLGCLNFISLF